MKPRYRLTQTQIHLHFSATWQTDSPSPSEALWRLAWPRPLCSICRLSSEVRAVLLLGFRHWWKNKILNFIFFLKEWKAHRKCSLILDNGSVLLYVFLIWFRWRCVADFGRQLSLHQSGAAHLAGASVAAGLSAAATGASAVLTSAVTGTVAWDTTSSETAAVVSASITGITAAVLSACTAGAAAAAGAAVSVVLKLGQN